MAQHFLLSAAARLLSPGKVMRMSDHGAENVFLRLRWPQTDGKPVCPNCGCQVCYDCRRSANQRRWRCRACRADFSITSGTLFAWHKLPLKTYLMAIAVFCNEVKGKSMLAFSRDLDVQYKTAFVLAHKLRETMASATRGLRIGGEGRTAEIDGAHFGGHVRPENLAVDRIDRRLAENQPGTRQVVVALRERGGRTLAQVFPAEADAVAAVRLRIAEGTTVHADESAAWNPLHASFAMRRVNHQDGYSIDGACTNGAESYFSRLRRGELGHHHHMATRPGCLDQPPTDHPGDLDPRDRLLGSVERTEQRLLDPFAAIVIGRRDGFDLHDAFGELTRRHWLSGLAQLVVDQPQALAWTEPGIACPRLLGADVVWPDIRIKQPHGGIDMRQIRPLLHKLSLKLTQRSCQFSTLVPQCTNDMQLGHHRPLLKYPRQRQWNA